MKNLGILVQSIASQSNVPEIRGAKDIKKKKNKKHGRIVFYLINTLILTAYCQLLVSMGCELQNVVAPEVHILSATEF